MTNVEYIEAGWQFVQRVIGLALRLAYWYLTKRENVVREHGALVPLVGCEAYGCTHEVA